MQDATPDLLSIFSYIYAQAAQQPPQRQQRHQRQRRQHRQQQQERQQQTSEQHSALPGQQLPAQRASQLLRQAVDEMEHVVQEATRSQRELQEKQAECDRLQQEVRHTREESDRLREQLDIREAELLSLQADANAVALQLEELSVAEEQAQAREAARLELQQQLLEMEGDSTACRWVGGWAGGQELV